MRPEDMENVWIYGFNLLLGGLLFFMRLAYSDLKDKVCELEGDNKAIKNDYFKKEDFREFKQELWHRFDELKSDIKRYNHNYEKG